MKRLLVFLAVFLPAITLVYVLSGGALLPGRTERVTETGSEGEAASESGIPDDDFASEAESEIRLGGSPTVKRLSAVDFDLRLYRETLDPVTHQRRFLRSVDFHGARSESVSDQEIAIRKPRITFHEIVEVAADRAEPNAPRDWLARPSVVVTALRGRLEAVGPDGVPRAAQEYDLCRLEGDVQVTLLADGAVLKTSSLECFFDERLVRTSERVEFDRGDATLTGEGFRAATLEGLWSILEDAILVATDSETGDDAVLIAPNGIDFENAPGAGEGRGGDDPETGIGSLRGGIARASRGVRLEQWTGRRGDSLEPRFEAEAETAVAILEKLGPPRGDAATPKDAESSTEEGEKKPADDSADISKSVGRALRSLELGGGVKFSDSRGLAGRADSLTLDRDLDELLMSGGPVIDIDAAAQKLPRALAAARPSSGEIRRLVLSARDDARVTGIGGRGAPSSLRLRGDASVRPFAEGDTTGGGLSGDDIEISLEPRPEGAPKAGSPLAVRDIVARGNASLDIPDVGRVRGPEIRLSAAGDDDDAAFEVVLPSDGELRFASDGRLTASLPGALRDDRGRSGAEDADKVPAILVVACEGPLEYIAPRAGAPGKLRLTHSARIEEWQGDVRTFRMTARNAEVALAADEGGSSRLVSFSAIGRVAVDATRGRLRARRLDFDASDETLRCEGEPAELEVIDPETGKAVESLRGLRITYFGALRLVEGEGKIEATVAGRPARESTAGDGASAERDFRFRMGRSGEGSAGPATLRCGRFRALVAERSTPHDPKAEPGAPAGTDGFEFEDLLAHEGVEILSGSDRAAGDTLTLARRGARITLAGPEGRPARLESPSPDDPKRVETVSGPSIVFEPGDGDGASEVAILPDGGEIVLFRSRSRDPFAVDRIRDKSETVKPAESGIVRTTVTTSGPIRLETGKEIEFLDPVRIEQTDEAGDSVSVIEGDRLTLELAPGAAIGAAGEEFVSARLVGNVRFDTPHARGSGGILFYDAKKNRIWLQRGESPNATLRFAGGNVVGREIEFDPLTSSAVVHEYESDFDRR